MAQMEVKENATLCGALYRDKVKVKENATVIGMPSLQAYLAFLGCKLGLEVEFTG